jgi:hypothetical protein
MILPHGKNKLSPYHLVKGTPADVSNLRNFGCLMCAISTKRCDIKLTTENIIRAKFLGYSGSMKTFIYYNIKNKKGGRATHARFDEAQLSASPDTLSPNSRTLRGDLQRSPGTDAPDVEAIVTPPEKFCVFADDSPFLQVTAVLVKIRCTFDAFGLIWETDPMSHQNLVTDFTPLSSASHLDWTRQVQFHTIIQVDDTPIYTVAEVLAAFPALADILPDSFHIIVAPYHPNAKDQHSPLPQVALDQLRIMHHVIHGWDLSDPGMLVTAKNADTMVKDTHHTRRTCVKGPNKDKWMEAEFDMLDKNDSYGMYGTIVKRRNVPSTAKIVRPIWNYSQKGNGGHKALTCMDGKQLVRMGVKFTNTYAACMEQHCIRLFMAIAAYIGHIIEYGDVVNVHAHAAAEGTQIYIAADAIFQSWHNARYGSQINEGNCIPLHKGIQCHPQAGNWWEKKINSACAAPLRLIPSFTEPTMYRRHNAIT